MANIEELSQTFEETLKQIDNSIDFYKYKSEVNKLLNRYALKLKNKDEICIEAKNIDIFSHYFEEKVKELNLSYKQIVSDANVSLSTLYKIKNRSFKDVSGFPKIKTRNKLVLYIKQKEKEQK